MQIAQCVLGIMLVVACVVVGIWDIICLGYSKPEMTVSNIYGHWAEQFPVFPFVLGMLAGHLFWPRGGASLPLPPGPVTNVGAIIATALHLKGRR